MNKDLQNIDILFKTAIDRAEEEPSSKVWDLISNELGNNEMVSISKKYHNLKVAASFLLILSAGVAMYILQINRKTKIPLKKNSDTISLNNKKEAIRNNIRQESDIQDKNITIQKEIFPVKTIPFVDSSNKNTGISSSTNKNEIKQLPRAIARTSSNKELGSFLSKLKTSGLNGFNHTIRENHKAGNFNTDNLNNINKIIVQKDEQKNKSDTLFKSIQTQSALTLAVPLFDPKMMMYNGIFPSALSLSNSNVQNYTNVKNRILKPLHESRITTTVFFSPDIVSYDIKNDQPQFEEDAKNEIRKNEKSQSANSFGILTGYKINRNWILQSGALISNRVTSIDSKTVYARPDRNGNINFRLSCFTGASYIPLKSGTHPAPGDSTIVTAKNTLGYISIPIVLQYRIAKGRLSISPGAGISANFLLMNKIESIINTPNGYQSSITNNNGLRTAYFNSSLSINAAYRISNRISISFTPVAQLGLSSITKDGPLKTMLNSYGFETGLSIDL